MTTPESLPRLDVTHMADALATVECPECEGTTLDHTHANECDPRCDGRHERPDGSALCPRGPEECEDCTTGRVPLTPELRVVVDEPLTVECETCAGSGVTAATPGQPGDGYEPCACTEDVTVALVVECETCEGHGVTYDDDGGGYDCHDCDSFGTVVVGTAHNGRLVEECRLWVIDREGFSGWSVWTAGTPDQWEPFPWVGKVERRLVYVFPHWEPVGVES